jgi:hypothetical protein
LIAPVLFSTSGRTREDNRALARLRPKFRRLIEFDQGDILGFLDTAVKMLQTYPVMH